MGPTRLCTVILALGLAVAARPVLAADIGTQDLAGESCHLSGPASVARSADIICGSGTAATGSLRLATVGALSPATGPARRAAIIAATKSAAGSGLAQPEVMSCDGGQSLNGDDMLFFCTLRSTAWPHIVLASATARGLFIAEGLPTLAPVLAAAIASQSGEAFGDAAAVVGAVRAKYPAASLTAGAGDYASYLQLVALGHNDSAAGNFTGAETAYRATLDVETRLFGPDSIAVGDTLLELALQVSNQGRFDEAAALFRRADPIIQSATSPAARTRLASYRALDAANQRNYADALKYARDVTAANRAEVDAAKTASLDPDDAGAAVVSPALEGELAHSLRIEAEMAMRLGDLPGAQAAAEEALYIVTKQQELPLSWRADMVSLMGDINDRAGRVVIAEHDFTDALAMDRKLYGDGIPTAMADLRLGKFYSDQQVYAAAIAPFRAAFAILAKDPVARALIVADQITPFLAAASALGDSTGERKKLEDEMFTASQMVESGVADQTIVRVAARQAAADPALAEQLRASDDAARREAGLRMDLAAERARPDDERDPAREKLLVGDLAAASAQSETLLQKIRSGFPGYTRLADPGAVKLADLQQALRPHEAFAGFVIGVHAGYVLLVTHDSLSVQPVGATVDSLSADIADLRSAFVLRVGQVPGFSLKSSYALYKQLLGPVEPALTGVDHLAVAAPGDLANLPFSLLVTGDPGQAANYSSAAWLIRRMTVSQVPSPRAFVALRAAKPAATPRAFLGLGNPTFTGNDGAAPGKALSELATACELGGPADAALLRALPPLPDTAAEVRAVAGDLNAAPGDILLGADANETALRAKPLDQYAVLYFATHGLLPGELHCQAEPGLVLSPPDGTAATTAADGLLTASEVAALKLNARLVVLSACNTAAEGGKHFGGGALDGLADAFFDAGAHAVLASHWEVPSAATMTLMTDMFANLARDPVHDMAEALRQAQLSLIARPDTAHPFDWAAFTLIGDGTIPGGPSS